MQYSAFRTDPAFQYASGLGRRQTACHPTGCGINPLCSNVRKITSPWGNEDTQQLIDILGRYHVKATFFVVGDWVEKYPGIGKSPLRRRPRGDEPLRPPRPLQHPLRPGDHRRPHRLQRQDRGHHRVRPTLFRPPYGEYDDHVISTVRGMGIQPIQWDVDSLDWKDYDAGHHHPAGDGKGGAGVHRPVSQRRPPHPRGPAGDFGVPPGPGVRHRPGEPAGPPRGGGGGLHH